MKFKLLPLAMIIAATIFFVPHSQAADKILKSGSFVGQSGHNTHGSVRIIERSGKVFVILAKDFFHDGAPDPKIAFGKNGFIKGTIIGKLQKLTGEQHYAVPTSLDIHNFNQVYVWCEQYAVPLGVASVQ